MAKGIAIGLLIASLILLIVYGADVALASSKIQEGPRERMGFLPFDDAVRGVAFGGSAVAMSIAAFVISRKEYAPAVSALLFVNGGLIIAGMLALIAQSALASGDSAAAMGTIGSTLVLGAILVGLGAWKVAIDRKTVPAKGAEPAQK
jgi:hypothetical protein